MSDKLGFTFYPKDWWSSDSFFDLTPNQRYIYLECLFIMYCNDGYMKTQKTQFENRIRINISDDDWNVVTEKFIIEDGLYTHISVNKRMRKTLSNRENGKKGGRPKKYDEEKPKKPKSETQKNPPLEREGEIKENVKEKYFNQFWQKYPKKVAKDKCKTAFLKLPQSDIDKILNTIDNFISYKPFENYIHPNPLTYLSQKRWNDEIETKPTYAKTNQIQGYMDASQLPPTNQFNRN